MPIHDFLSDLQIWTTDGIPIHLGDLVDVQTFDDTDAPNEQTITWNNTREATITGATIYMSKRFKNLLLYGWAAKGPVRKRVLKKLREKVLK